MKRKITIILLVLSQILEIIKVKANNVEAYHFYNWVYAVNPEISRGKGSMEPNLDRYSRSFFRLLQQKHNINPRNLNIDINDFVADFDFPNDIHRKVRKNRNLISDTSSVLVFVLAEPTTIGIRAFIFDKKLKAIKNDTSFFFKKDSLLVQSPQILYDWIVNTNTKKKKIKHRKDRIFRECLLRFRVEYHIENYLIYKRKKN